MKVYSDAHVAQGPPCPECGRLAIFVVEDRSMYKCGNGDRWLRDRAEEES